MMSLIGDLLSEIVPVSFQDVAVLSLTKQSGLDASVSSNSRPLAKLSL